MIPTHTDLALQLGKLEGKFTEFNSAIREDISEIKTDAKETRTAVREMQDTLNQVKGGLVAVHGGWKVGTAVTAAAASMAAAVMAWLK